MMPFSCGKRSANICVVLGPKKSSPYSSEYASGFSEPVALHLPASPSPRNEGLLGQTPALMHHAGWTCSVPIIPSLPGRSEEFSLA